MVSSLLCLQNYNPHLSLYMFFFWANIVMSNKYKLYRMKYECRNEFHYEYIGEFSRFCKLSAIMIHRKNWTNKERRNVSEWRTVYMER